MKPIEPGLLPTFRLFIGIQLAHAVVGELMHEVGLGQAHAVIIASSTSSLLRLGLLLLYLSIPSLSKQLKSFYLPIGIAWATAGTLLDLFSNLFVVGSASPDTLIQVLLWRQMILLLIPLIALSWQYSLLEVGLFSALTTLLSTAFLTRTLTLQELISGSLVGTAIFQMAVFLLVGNMIVSLMRVQRGQRQRLTEANIRLSQYASTLEQLTISRERNRMARELHDVLAHTLSGVAVELGGVRTMLRRDPDRADELLEHSRGAIRGGLIETRRALQALRAQPLEDMGLALAVRTLAESCVERSDLRMSLCIDPDVNEYPAEVQQCVYRIAQEALANVAHHAQASQTEVVLKQEQGQLHLIISDDGRGFDPGRFEDEHHYGLRGMRERADMIGAALSVQSQIGKGTCISFSYGGRS